MSRAKPQRCAKFYPVLCYRDAAAAIAWLETTFGFERLMVVPDADGGVRHAELGAGGGVVMLASASGDDVREQSGMGQMVYVAVDDVDAYYARATAAGAEVTRALHDTDYGSRDFAVRDPEGYEWSFGTYRPGD